MPDPQLERTTLRSPVAARGGAAGRPAMIGAVVVSHQSSAELDSCLDAVLGAAGVAQVVVVDNASSDGSLELVRQRLDPRLQLLALTENLGFAGGCNCGYEALDPELPWIAFLNPDVQVQPDCLARCAELMAGDELLAGVAPRLMRPDGATMDSLGQLLSPKTLEVHDRGYGQALQPELMAERQVLAACGALAVFRRRALASCLETTGPFAAHFFCFWEDLELGWRLVNRGWIIRSAPDAVAVHGRGAGAAAGGGPLRWRRPARLEACILSNRWMTLIRHLHTRDLIARLPRLLVWDTALCGLGLLRRPVLALYLARRLPLVWREWRRRSQFPRRRLAELPW